MVLNCQDKVPAPRNSPALGEPAIRYDPILLLIEAARLLEEYSRYIARPAVPYSAHDGGFFCPQCGVVFRRKQDLKRHAIRHSGLRAFSCTRCDRSFARKDALVRHVAKACRHQYPPDLSPRSN
ncbi:hypothetical protein DSO57_1007137 [Entomophthora muscae]|uniref:Uncharacterized protein n=1 Tax=Entomophthora muscae TaxID=34485 RepID=A0ACC2T7K1_9FUNG|nr:hypothetical protein DSO57_1007137 [Entomophthora muscae]